jgi:Ca2+-transporting ATPase
MAVIVASAGLQAIIVEFGGAAFKVHGLSWDQWLFCIAMGALELPLGFILRAVPVPERHYFEILQVCSSF